MEFFTASHESSLMGIEPFKQRNVNQRQKVLRLAVVILTTLACGMVWVPYFLEHFLTRFMSPHYFFQVGPLWGVTGVAFFLLGICVTLIALFRKDSVAIYGVLVSAFSLFSAVMPFIPGTVHVPDASRITRVEGYHTDHPWADVRWAIEDRRRISDIVSFLKRFRRGWVLAPFGVATDWTFSLNAGDVELMQVWVGRTCLYDAFRTRHISHEEAKQLWKLVYAEDDTNVVRTVEGITTPPDMMSMMMKLWDVDTNFHRDTGLDSFDWESGKNLERGRRKLRKLLAQHGIAAPASTLSPARVVALADAHAVAKGRKPEQCSRGEPEYHPVEGEWVVVYKPRPRLWPNDYFEITVNDKSREAYFTPGDYEKRTAWRNEPPYASPRRR
jgi:hypothetical protein